MGLNFDAKVENDLKGKFVRLYIGNIALESYYADDRERKTMVNKLSEFLGGCREITADSL